MICFGLEFNLELLSGVALSNSEVGVDSSFFFRELYRCVTSK